MEGLNNGRPIFTGTQPQPAQTSAGGEHANGNKEPHTPRKVPRLRKGDDGIWSGFRYSSVVLLFGIIVLVVGILLLLAVGSKQESGYVNKTDYQAVFVNVTGSSGGQAYFGHIAAISPTYITLDSVFYLESSTSSSQFTLNNLGCTIYGPQDQMIINRQQVDFWENLNPSSQVTKEINQYYTQKLTCSATASNSTSNNTTGTGSSTSSGGSSSTSNKSGSTSTNP